RRRARRARVARAAAWAPRSPATAASTTPTAASARARPACNACTPARGRAVTSAGASDPRPRGLRLEELLQDRTQLRADVGPLQGERDRRLDEADLVAGVVARALDLVAVERPLAGEDAEAVGQLDLAAGAFRRAREDLEHLRREDVAARDDREIGRRG